MSKIPAELKYARTHEWLRPEDDGSVTLGISDHAQEALGDLVFVETPEVGRSVAPGEACAVVESVKAASDVYSPIAGEVTAVNEALATQPELLNSDPYGEGWIMKIRPASASETPELLDAKAYAATLED
ncbi:glycine cleavage system protein GcvH [Wenzhouxiangella sp. XN24]|uniref:glycine cleavage system protein GcvH n=1 Tax=Wenzhouxiangella sp. XN24 TaxID=2713569 RepID=UPI0013EC2C51|nr:glycine cleavage system protein GcvH [Wenzhouxiangella sp. XN24]NGX15875.1 glycine cleavage system protein GcvH [Wenzhouxiangella sp. XN24]